MDLARRARSPSSRRGAWRCCRRRSRSCVASPDSTTAREVIADAPSRVVVPLIPRQLVGDDGTTRWVLAHDRTGEVLVDGIAMPHTRETDGLPTDRGRRMSGHVLPLAGSSEPWAGGEVTSSATCVLAPNPSPWTLDGTNTWLLTAPGSDRAVVVDPGSRPCGPPGADPSHRRRARRAHRPGAAHARPRRPRRRRPRPRRGPRRGSAGTRSGPSAGRRGARSTATSSTSATGRARRGHSGSQSRQRVVPAAARRIDPHGRHRPRSRHVPGGVARRPAGGLPRQPAPAARPRRCVRRRAPAAGPRSGAVVTGKRHRRLPRASACAAGGGAGGRRFGCHGRGRDRRRSSMRTCRARSGRRRS